MGIIPGEEAKRESVGAMMAGLRLKPGRDEPEDTEGAEET